MILVWIGEIDLNTGEGSEEVISDLEAVGAAGRSGDSEGEESGERGKKLALLYAVVFVGVLGLALFIRTNLMQQPAKVQTVAAPPVVKPAPITLKPVVPTSEVRQRGKRAFNAAAIDMDAVYQKEARNDSFVTATLIALANSNSGRIFISEMVDRVDENTYAVYFPRENPERVTVEQIKQMGLENKSVWASVIEAAFLAHFDLSAMKRQFEVNGQPAIVLALNALSESGNQVVNPAKESEASLDQLLAELSRARDPVVVSLKNSAEIEDPLIEHPIALALVKYDSHSHSALLQSAYPDKLRTKAVGVKQLGPATYAVPLKLLPSYVRFIAFNQTPQ